MRPEPGASSPGSAKRFALLGDPVDHSLSPRIHNAAFDALGLDAAYDAVRCAADDVPALMRSLAGGNVTVPHKRVAAAAVERAGDAVRATGACNTFWTEDGALHGDNTDVAGFERALRDFIGDPADTDVLLLGAGGAAAAALHALLAANVGRVTILNRTHARALDMVARVAGLENPRVRLVDSLDEVQSDPFDVAVNATTLGMRSGDALPLPVAETPAYAAAFDLVYAADGRGTAWVRAARDAGLPATDGTDMLLHQAAAAFERWWQQPAPLEAMRRALGSAARK